MDQITGKKRRRKAKVAQLSAPLIKAQPTESQKKDEDKTKKKTPQNQKNKDTEPEAGQALVENGTENEEAATEVQSEEQNNETEKQDNEDEEQDPPAKKIKIPDEIKDQLDYENRERVLVFCTRGITHKERMLMNDLRRILPHSRKEGKFEDKNKLSDIIEICEMKNCNNCIFFESRKRKDLYMWMCKTPKGPGCKFLVTGVVPMSEHRLTGNCLKGSRPLLSFSAHFDQQPQYQLMKEMIVQIFNVPKAFRKGKPFIDHIIAFSVQGDRIWFRHFQILENDKGTQDLVEIGPRFVLQLIRIFDGSFGGETLYKNPDYVNPNKIRSDLKKRQAGRYVQRVQDREKREKKDEELRKDIPHDERDDIFN